MRRIALALACLAALAAATAVVVLTLDDGAGSARRLGPRPLVATASVGPAHVLFGDPVTARVEIAADRRVDPGSIRIGRDFAPFGVVSVGTTRTESDGLTRIAERIELACLGTACLPTDGAPGDQPGRTVPLDDLRIDYRVDGVARVLSLPLPPVEIVSRLSSLDRAKPAGRLRVPAEVPPVTYAVSPGSLSTAMIATAGALLALALVLVLLAVRGAFGRRLREDGRSPLERSLAAVREAAVRGDARRLRVALGWLARELRASGRDEIAGDALRLAWSSGTPQAAAIAALARDVEEGAPNES